MSATHSLEDPDENLTVGDDGYDPKTKNLKLSIAEKLIIAIGSLFVVMMMILIHHPELYRKEQERSSGPEKNMLPMGATQALLVPGWAKPAETHEFASFNLDKSAGTYNVDYSGLTLSSVGIGTYLGETTDEIDTAVKAAVYDSVMKGVNVIDTAINYRGMKSERCVGSALRRILQSGTIARDSLFISTKAGFIPGDSDKGTSPLRTASEWSAAVSQYGDFPQQEIVDGKHCIAPACLNISLATSRYNLGIETIDLFYLHNAAEKQMGTVSDFMTRLKASFTYLEEQRRLNTIRYYGMATWNCFTVDRDSSPEYLSLYDVVKLAESVGGSNHGFRYIQLPVTVSIPGAATMRTQRAGPTGEALSVLEAAAIMNVTVMSSRSIGGASFDSLSATESVYHDCLPKEHDFSQVLSRKMLKIASKHSAKAHSAHIHLSQAAKTLLITRSIPGVITALVGMKLVNHVNENVNVLNLPLIPRGVVSDCILTKGADRPGDSESANRKRRDPDMDGPTVKGNILPIRSNLNNPPNRGKHGDKNKNHGHVRKKKQH